MICTKCREAGQLNKALNTLPHEGTIGHAVDVQTKKLGIADLHAKCYSVLVNAPTWCDCQHLVGTFVNRRMVD